MATKKAENGASIFPAPASVLNFEKVDFFIFLFLLILCLMASQDYFTHFEPSRALGWAKTGDAREKLPDYPQAEFGLSYM